MKVYKFGGASVKDAWGIRNLGKIVGESDDKLVVVVSALGKTTNMLEEVILSLKQGPESYKAHLEKVFDYHSSIAIELFGKEEAGSLLNSLFDSADKTIVKLRSAEFDFLYDQFVSFGELWSTKIVERWMHNSGMKSKWIDARENIITDEKFRDASVDWDETSNRIQNVFINNDADIVVTQGFVAGTLKGETTTLGREGSDFTAAIIANICDASDLTIWKDVSGVMNADPQWLDNTQKLDNISYKEAVEMSFSGAKIIHPNTIKPLHNKSIPLFVKSFLEPKASGTIVSLNESIEQELPVYVKKESQVLISFIPKDLSFVIGDNLGLLFQILNRCGVNTNMVQTSAVSIAVCVDDEVHKISEVSDLLGPEYKILLNHGLEMLTIRHYDEAAINLLTGSREILIEQRTRKSVRFVVK